MTAENSEVRASGRAASWITTTSISPASIAGASSCRACHSELCRLSPPVTTASSGPSTSRSTVASTLARSWSRITSTVCVIDGSSRAHRIDQVKTRRPASGSSTLFVW